MNDVIAKPISPTELIAKIFRYGAQAVEAGPAAAEVA